MRILFISRGFPNNKDSMYGNFEADQARAIQTNGIQSIFLCIDRRLYAPKGRKWGMTKDVIDGIIVYKLFLFPLPVKFCLRFTTWITILLGRYLFRRILKENGLPDIIHAHYLFNIPIAVDLGKKYDIPVVATEHWSAVNQPQLANYIKYLGNISYSKVDKLIAVSSVLSQSIKKHFDVNSVVINNMIGKEFVSKKKIQFLNDDKNFNFVAIGSLLPIKGFDILIDAFYRTGLSIKGCKLTVIGEGKERSKLQEIIDRLSLNDSVNLVGAKNKLEVISCLQNSNVFVLSSHSETFSVVCIEAMYFGIPIVATACGGPEEFVTEEVGVLVKPADIDALAIAMKKMYDNIHTYDRGKISEYCRSRFSPEIIGNKLITIYNEVK